MSVVFPIATLLSFLSCIAEVPHRHPQHSFQVNFFLLYMVSQVIPNSSFLHVRNHLMLHLLTHTHHFVSPCFTEFTAQTVRPTFLHTLMFDVSFSNVSQEERLWWRVISKFRATVFTHPHWEPKQPHLSAAVVSLAFIFEVLQCSNITETLQRCYGNTTWLGLSCTVLGCMCSRSENKACFMYSSRSRSMIV